jgi:arylsulfatase A-like enzyme
LLEGPDAIGKRCIGGRHVHQYTFDYIQQIWDNYANRPKFAFSSFIESQQKFAAATSGALDADLASFIQHMTHSRQHKAHGKPKFHDTILFLLADHGAHADGDEQSISASLSSDSGRAEHQLPAFFLIVPTGYLNEHPWLQETLKANQQAVITAYDIYATLIDIATHGTHQFEEEPPKLGLHARSLFSKIEVTRTCTAAKIAPHMCACEPSDHGFSAK